MNDLEKALLDYEYNDRRIHKWINIFKRTKKKRIKNKQFVKILFAAVEERKVIRAGEVVLLDMEVYSEMEYLANQTSNSRSNT